MKKVRGSVNKSLRKDQGSLETTREYGLIVIGRLDWEKLFKEERFKNVRGNSKVGGVSSGVAEDQGVELSTGENECDVDEASREERKEVSDESRPLL